MGSSFSPATASLNNRAVPHASRACDFCKKRKQRCKVTEICEGCYVVGESECHHNPCTYCISKDRETSCTWTGIDLRNPLNRAQTNSMPNTGTTDCLPSSQLPYPASIIEVPAFTWPTYDHAVELQDLEDIRQLRIDTDLSSHWHQQRLTDEEMALLYTSMPSEETPVLSPTHGGSHPSYDPTPSPLDKFMIPPVSMHPGVGGLSPNSVMSLQKDPFVNQMQSHASSAFVQSMFDADNGHATTVTNQSDGFYEWPLPKDDSMAFSAESEVNQSYPSLLAPQASEYTYGSFTDYHWYRPRDST